MAKEMEAESTTPDPVVPAGDIKGVATLASTSTTPDPVAPAGAIRDAGTLDPPPPYLAAITQMDTTKVVTTQPSMTPLDPAQLGAAKPVPVYVYAEQPPEKEPTDAQTCCAACALCTCATCFMIGVRAASEALVHVLLSCC